MFSDIIVTPFLNLAPSDKKCLDELFQAGRLDEGTYHLAGYPAKGPRAVLKVGFVDDLRVYASDVDRSKIAGDIFVEPAMGFVGDILDLIEARRGVRSKVAEVWWFHSSPHADEEWHAFMENLAHQVGEQIFFAPVKPPKIVESIDFRKPPGSDVLTMTLALCDERGGAGARNQ